MSVSKDNVKVLKQLLVLVKKRNPHLLLQFLNSAENVRKLELIEKQLKLIFPDIASLK